MKQIFILTIFLLSTLLLLAACNPAGGSEPVAEVPEQNETTSEPIDEEPVDEESVDEESVTEKVSIENCAEATAGTHQLIYAAQGICFLYPDKYDVFQSEDGSLTLYVKSLMNTEAPLATVRIAALNGRSIQEVVPDYPSDADLATMSFLSIDLGEETATVMDILPGQDTNRRVITVHDDKVYDLMIARIGTDYGAVGEEAEALYELITTSWQFIGVEPDAPLLAGPECPEAPTDTILFTNDIDRFCMLLPAGYEVEISDGQTAVYVDSLQDVTHAKMFINVADANGRTLDDVSTEKAAEIETIMGEAPMWSFGYMLDGVPANQFDQVPGQDLSRQVLLVHNDRLYTLTFIPDEAAVGDAYTEMETLYEMVMDSFSFLQ